MGKANIDSLERPGSFPRVLLYPVSLQCGVGQLEAHSLGVSVGLCPVPASVDRHPLLCFCASTFSPIKWNDSNAGPTDGMKVSGLLHISASEDSCVPHICFIDTPGV